MKQGKYARPALLWMADVAGRAKLSVAVLLLVQAVLGVSSVAYAMLLREIVNAAVGGDSSGFVWASMAFAGLVVFQIALRAVNRFFEELSRSGMENRFKGRLFSTLLSKDYASVTKVNSGEWVNRLTSDTVVVADGLAQILPGVAGMAVKMAGAMAAILYLEPKFIFILVPGGLLLIFFFHKKFSPLFEKWLQNHRGRWYNSFVEELLLGLSQYAQYGFACRLQCANAGGGFL